MHKLKEKIGTLKKNTKLLTLVFKTVFYIHKLKEKIGTGTLKKKLNY